MDIIIVCHTEFGLVRNKKVIADKRAISGAREGVINLVEVAEKYGAKISFAVCPEVAEYFPKNINHEIGLHIHPGWEEYKTEGIKFIAGDEYLRKNCKQSFTSTVLRDYSYIEQSEMIKKGKERIVKTFGISPKFFVAGRWCVNNNTIKALVENDFTHECSAPAHSISDHYDWSKLPRICMPYHPDKNNYQKKGTEPILILPISQYFPLGNVNPEVVPLTGLSWLKASFMEYYKQGVPLFHICLHSPSMTDRYFISAMEDFISFISKHKGINFKFASQIKEYEVKDYKTNILPYLFSLNWKIVKKFLLKLI